MTTSAAATTTGVFVKEPLILYNVVPSEETTSVSDQKTPITFHQYRTREYVYVFEHKKPDVLTVKVYKWSVPAWSNFRFLRPPTPPINYSRVSKLSCGIPQTEILDILNKPSPDKLFKYFPELQKELPSAPSLLKDPVAMFDHLLFKTFKPLDSFPYEPINVLPLNADKNKDVEKLLDYQVEVFAQDGNLQLGLEKAKEALECTKSLQDYPKLASMYQSAGQPWHARRVFLWNAKYQYLAGNIAGAIDSLKIFLDLSHLTAEGKQAGQSNDWFLIRFNNQVRRLLAYLYASQEKHKEAIYLVSALIDNKRNQLNQSERYSEKELNKIHAVAVTLDGRRIQLEEPETLEEELDSLYHYVLHQDPSHLFSLLGKWEGPGGYYFLLRGACSALERGEMELADNLLALALARAMKNCWLDQYVRIELLFRENAKLRLTSNLDSLINEWKEEPKLLVKLYSFMSRSSLLRPEDYQPFFKAQLQHKQDKIVPWAIRELEILSQDKERNKSHIAALKEGSKILGKELHAQIIGDNSNKNIDDFKVKKFNISPTGNEVGRVVEEVKV